MKKLNYSILGVILIASLAHAKPDSDKFFYDKGFSDGKKEGVRLGYKKAKKEIMKKLKKRISAIKAMEAGKYLSKKHKITAPEIYQVRKPDGTLSVKVKGCRLEKELTPEEIVQLPKAPHEMSYSDNIYSNTNTPASISSGTPSQKGISNGVFVPGIDAATQQTPKLASKLTGAVYSHFPNTQFYIDLLRTAGLPFTITNGGDSIKARFESYRDRDTFLVRYDLEPGRDVQ